MKYLLNTTNYSNFNLICENTIKPRSYFICYEDEKVLKEVSLLNERYSSTLVRCLNGDWNFKFYKNPNDLEINFDTCNINFDVIDVPSCWQYRNYDRPFYLNCRYQFPCKPPLIPTLNKVGKCFNVYGNNKFLTSVTPEDEYNFVGVYQKEIELNKKLNKRYVLSFLGVSSSIDLYVNGEYVGYAEGMHHMHEFDVTNCLLNGKNELLVVVHRWTNGSYLECQDMFRNNGIFRDVLLKEEEYLFEYSLHFNKVDNKYELEANISLYKEAEVEIEIETLQTKVSNINKEHHIKFSSLEVKEWNAETPYTYPLLIKVKESGVVKEVTRKYIGFKDVKIVNDKFYLNNKLIKIKGVNHHDTSPTNGYYLTPQEIEKDILICKDYNVNTIRTSHYPSDPLLLDLATVHGLYIIDEADLEAHGCQLGTINMDFNKISKDPKWEKHYLDRAVHLYERDKNNSCIIMWSLGNEAGGYQNQDKMYSYLKEKSKLPIHYESAVHSKRKAYDVGSQMYPPLEMVESVGKHSCKIKEFNDRPYILCEYAHAMGVGPGALKEYMELFYKYDNLMGGCIWEMVDHAYLDKDSVYRYGGDFNEYMHDSNFCVDGLFYPDRKPSTGAKIMKYEYRPLRFTHIKENVFEIFNTNSFIDANEYNVEIDVNNIKFNRRFSLKSLSKDTFELPLESKEENIVYFRVYYNNKLVSEESILVNYKVENDDKLESKAKLENYQLIFENGKVYIENQKVVIEYFNEKLEYSDFGTLLFRAPTDNDFNTLGFKLFHNNLNQVNIIENVFYEEGKITISNYINSGKSIFRNVDEIEVDSKGKIIFTSKLIPQKGKDDIFRFAKSFKLDSCFNQVNYFGRSLESYCDMKDHALVKENSYLVSEMTEPNIRPQESGNRCDCKYVSLIKDNLEIKFTALVNPFEIGIKPYSDVELLKMKHRNDEICSGTYINICKFNRGIGTGACGPITLEKYKYYPANYELKFIIEAKVI